MRSVFGPYFPVSRIMKFTEIFSVFSPNTGKYGPEKTLYLVTFHAVVYFQFDKNTQEVNYFCWEASSQMFDRVINTPLKSIPKNVSRNFVQYQGSFIYYLCQIFRKTKISYSLIRTRTCTYQVVRNISFSENFTYLLNE